MVNAAISRRLINKKAGAINPGKKLKNMRENEGTRILNFSSEEILKSLENGILEDSKIPIHEKIFIPDWNNKPEPIPDVLKLSGTPILGHQNLTGIIANPGFGKSSIVESIGANLLNPSADCLGFEVDQSCNGIIIVDNERTNADVWNSFSRMCRRAGIVEGGGTNNIILAGMRSIARLSERIQAIESLLENNPCSLLLFDGAGDLVEDTNDLSQAIECRIWLREITVKYNTSILVTLHPNPNSNKPRGHQGSEICREAECVLLIKNYEGDHRLITSDFEQGKNRNNPKLTTAFTWSDDNKMFISADYEDLQFNKQTAKDGMKRQEADRLAKEIISPPNALKYGEFVSAIMQKTSVSEPTARRKIKDMDGWGIINKSNDNFYRYEIRSRSFHDQFTINDP